MASNSIRRAFGLWGVVCIVFQIVRTAGWESYFRHFTAWSWTLHAIFFVLVWVGKPVADINTVVVLPTVFTSVWFVFIAISVLVPWGVDLVTDSIADYGRPMVGGFNFLLHYVPWLALMVYMVLDEPELRSRTVSVLKACGEANRIGTLMLFNATLPTCFVLSYFFWFDATREYGIHGIAQWIVVVVVATLAVVISGLYWLWAAVPPRTQPVKTQ